MVSVKTRLWETHTECFRLEQKEKKLVDSCDHDETLNGKIEELLLIRLSLLKCRNYCVAYNI